MQYSLNKYTVIEYTSNGIDLEEPILVGADHDNVVMGKVREIFTSESITRFTLTTQYRYDPVLVDTTSEGAQ